MRVERPNPARPGATDLFTRCDNPACDRERYNGYTAPWVTFAGTVSFEWDGWLQVLGSDACSWACLAVVAATRATEEEEAT